MDRNILRDAYSQLSLEQRRALSKITGKTLAQLYTYCMRPSSDHIGRERKQKLLEFMPEEEWLALAKQAQEAIIKGSPIELKIEWPEDLCPDVVIINGQRYIQEPDQD